MLIMDKFWNFIVSGLTSGKYTSFQDETNMDAMLRLTVLNITYTFASIMIISFGVSDMQRGNVDLGLVQLILGFLIFTNLFLLRTELPFAVGGFIVTAVFGCFCAFSFFTKHEIRGIESIWIYSFPLMAIFTLGLPAGLIYALLLFAVIVMWVFTHSYAVLHSVPPNLPLSAAFIFL